MTKKIKLVDLCCANCAAKIEEKTAKIDGVNSVTVNFLTEKMILDIDESKADSIYAEIKKIVQKIEPDVKMEGI